MAQQDAPDVDVDIEDQDRSIELKSTTAKSDEADEAAADDAAAVKDEVRAEAEAKISSSYEWSTDDLVETPGNMETILFIWIFFLQKLSLQWLIGVNWPSWFLNFLDILGILCFGVPAFGIGLEWLMIPADCIFAAKLLLHVALLVRYSYLAKIAFAVKTNGGEAPRYSSAAEVVRTVAHGIAIPTLLSALAIMIGAWTGTNWLTGLGVALCWPIIGYLVIAHVVRVQIWKACCIKYVNRVTTCISRASVND